MCASFYVFVLSRLHLVLCSSRLVLALYSSCLRLVCHRLVFVLPCLRLEPEPKQLSPSRVPSPSPSWIKYFASGALPLLSPIRELNRNVPQNTQNVPQHISPNIQNVPQNVPQHISPNIQNVSQNRPQNSGKNTSGTIGGRVDEIHKMVGAYRRRDSKMEDALRKTERRIGGVRENLERPIGGRLLARNLEKAS